ncbi:MAG: hypothetical protein QMD61_11665, partial [Methanobacterium sp.]|nr:hypothetical protein [Methanobacterium sp.]
CNCKEYWKDCKPVVKTPFSPPKCETAKPPVCKAVCPPAKVCPPKCETDKKCEYKDSRKDDWKNCKCQTVTKRPVFKRPKFKTVKKPVFKKAKFKTVKRPVFRPPVFDRPRPVGVI